MQTPTFSIEDFPLLKDALDCMSVDQLKKRANKEFSTGKKKADMIMALLRTAAKRSSAEAKEETKGADGKQHPDYVDMTKLSRCGAESGTAAVESESVCVVCVWCVYVSLPEGFRRELYVRDCVHTCLFP